MGRTARDRGDQICHGPQSRGFPALGATEMPRLAEKSSEGLFLE